MEYFLQCTGNKPAWEEVNEYTFKNWKQAQLDDGTPRYTGKRLSHNEGTNIEFVGNFDKQELASICRLVGMKDIAGGGLCPTKPDYIKFVNRGYVTLLNLATGERFSPKKAG